MESTLPPHNFDVLTGLSIKEIYNHFTKTYFQQK